MKPSALSPVVALVTALLAASCLPDDRAHAVQQAAPPPVQPSQAANVTILTGGTLTTDPGKGAGVFVEYLGQGQWSVWTSCDSAVQGGQCQYDLYLTPESGGSVVAAALDPQTGTLSSAAGGADAHWVTSYARNAVNLTVSPPGSGLLVDARLDGVSDPHVFYWQGPDVVHTGAPTDPVLFLPTVP